MATHKVNFGISVSVQIMRDIDQDNATVRVLSPLYKCKEFTMPHSYKSSVYSDYQILNDSDFTRVMFNHFPK